MKTIFISLTFLLLIPFISCSDNNQSRETTCNQENPFPENSAAGSLCSDELCTNYFTIWKELLIEKNDLSQDFFDSHIELGKSDIHSWNDGV